MSRRQSTTTRNNKTRNDGFKLLPYLMALTLVLLASETTAFLQPKRALRNAPGPTTEFLRAMSRNSVREKVHASKLFYRDGNDEHVTGIDRKAHSKAMSSVRSKISSWWNGSVAPTSDVPMDSNTQQEEVDRYLEFLDKRYHRLHDDEVPEPKKNQPKEDQRKLSVLDWLSTDGNSNVEYSQATRKENDALYVLGVAGLASERLLMKHQRVQPRSRKTELSEDEEGVIDTKATKDMAVKVAHVSSVMLRELSRRRRALIRYQNMQIRKALRLSTKAIIEAPFRTGKTLWEIGGGKRTFALTVSMLTAAFLLVRPVVAVVIKTVVYRNPVVG